jgi:hypothetical protein
MNRKQRLLRAYRELAQSAVNEHLEYKTTFILSGVIIAMDSAHAKVNYEKFLQEFARIYPRVLKEPNEMMEKAEEISGCSLEIHWEE